MAPDEFAHEVLVDRLHAARGRRRAELHLRPQGRGQRRRCSPSSAALRLRRRGHRPGDAARRRHGLLDLHPRLHRRRRRGRRRGGAGPPAPRRGRRRARRPPRPRAGLPHRERRDPALHGAARRRRLRRALRHSAARRLPSAISVGTNPTFSGRERTVEAYVLDVDEDFYGFDVGVDVEHWLRGQERFDDSRRAAGPDAGRCGPHPRAARFMIFSQTPTAAGDRLPT